MPRKDQPGQVGETTEPQCPPGLVQVQTSRHNLMVLCGALVLLAIIVTLTGYWLGTRGFQASTNGTPAAQTRAVTTRIATFHAKRGPWGDLECQRTILESPDEILAIHRQEVSRPRWYFKGYSGAVLRELLLRLELTAKQKTELLNSNNWRFAANSIEVEPSDETILSLASTT